MANKEIADLTADATPASSDEIETQKTGGGVSRKLTLQNLIRQLIGLEVGGGTDNYILNPDDNSMDSTVGTSTIIAAGSSSFPNILGDSTAAPVGQDFTPGTWAGDSSYVAGAADASSIVSGYDNVLNAIGSSIIGNHHFIEYSVNGHNTIVGNSYCYIKSGRGTIIGSRNSEITGNTNTFGVIVGGEGSAISAGNYQSILNAKDSTIAGANPHSTIIGGLDHDISSGAGTYNTLIGGQENTISATGNRNVVIGGGTNVISGATSYSAIIGAQSSDISASYSVILGGEDNLVQHTRTVASGTDAIALSRNSYWMGGTALNEAGDAQLGTIPMRVRTTDATLTNMTTDGSAYIDLNDSKKNTGTMKILLVGMRDGSADGNNDADYTQVAYTLEGGFYWDGTNGFLFKSGTQTSVTTAPTLDMDLISQTNNDFTAGAAPHVAINTGSLRVKVTGIASTVINWTAKIDIAMTLAD